MINGSAPAVPGFDVLSLLESDVRLTYLEFDVLSMVHIRFEQIRSSLISCLRIGFEGLIHRWEKERFR